jgi:hypothetical protein
MENFLVIVIFGGLCFFLGWKTREIYAYRIVDKMMNNMIAEMADKATEELKKKIINIKVEDHNGQFFVYATDDNRYLAHAESMTKLENILQEKFPGILFNASSEDLKKLHSR